MVLEAPTVFALAALDTVDSLHLQLAPHDQMSVMQQQALCRGHQTRVAAQVRLTCDRKTTAMMLSLKIVSESVARMTTTMTL